MLNRQKPVTMLVTSTAVGAVAVVVIVVQVLRDTAIARNGNKLSVQAGHGERNIGKWVVDINYHV
jgi:hypothetical protein